MGDKFTHRVHIIAAVDKNWAIGYQNQLLVSIPTDMKFFQTETMGSTIIMGRRTFESLPKKRPLANRRNIILSHRTDYRIEGAETAGSIEEVFGLIHKEARDKVYVIGGESIYNQMLPFCTMAHITKIKYRFLSDTYFPDLDRDGNWYLDSESESYSYGKFQYSFCKYVRKDLNIMY